MLLATYHKSYILYYYYYRRTKILVRITPSGRQFMFSKNINMVGPCQYQKKDLNQIRKNANVKNKENKYCFVFKFIKNNVSIS